jgi:hypothetical protein
METKNSLLVFIKWSSVRNLHPALDITRVERRYLRLRNMEPRAKVAFAISELRIRRITTNASKAKLLLLAVLCETLGYSGFLCVQVLPLFGALKWHWIACYRG